MTRIESFKVEDGGLDDLRKYVDEKYKFLGKLPAAALRETQDEAEIPTDAAE